MTPQEIGAIESRLGAGASSVAGGGGGAASRIAHACVAASQNASRFMQGGAKQGVWLGVTVSLVRATWHEQAGPSKRRQSASVAHGDVAGWAGGALAGGGGGSGAGVGGAAPEHPSEASTSAIPIV